MSCMENNDNTERNCNCLSDLLQTILDLQNRTSECDLINNGCDKPFLGPTPTFVCFNTRPVRFFRCLDGEAWTLPYTLNGTTGTSDIFRVESLDGCCATCRILIPNPDTENVNVPFIATDSFFTINLECVGAISCLADTFISNC